MLIKGVNACVEAPYDCNQITTKAWCKGGQKVAEALLRSYLLLGRCLLKDPAGVVHVECIHSWFLSSNKLKKKMNAFLSPSLYLAILRLWQALWQKGRSSVSFLCKAL